MFRFREFTSPGFGVLGFKVVLLFQLKGTRGLDAPHTILEQQLHREGYQWHQWEEYCYQCDITLLDAYMPRACTVLGRALFSEQHNGCS